MNKVMRKEIEKIIEEAKDKLVKVFDPIEIYLFGSYAWGCPDEESDLDFLVVVEESTEKPYKRCYKGHLALSDMKVPKDLIVYTKDEFEPRAADITTLCYKVVNEGRKIYTKS